MEMLLTVLASIWTEETKKGKTPQRQARALERVQKMREEAEFSCSRLLCLSAV